MKGTSRDSHILPLETSIVGTINQSFEMNPYNSSCPNYRFVRASITRSIEYWSEVNSFLC